MNSLYFWTDIIKDHDISLILEYAGEKATRSRRDKRPAFGSGLGRVFTNSFLSTITYKASDALEIDTKLLFNLDEHLSFLVKPETHYDITDKIRITLGFNFIEGNKSTFFGQFDNDDRAYLFLRYSF